MKDELLDYEDRINDKRYEKKSIKLLKISWILLLSFLFLCFLSGIENLGPDGEPPFYFLLGAPITFFGMLIFSFKGFIYGIKSLKAKESKLVKSIFLLSCNFLLFGSFLILIIVNLIMILNS